MSPAVVFELGSQDPISSRQNDRVYVVWCGVFVRLIDGTTSILANSFINSCWGPHASCVRFLCRSAAVLTAFEFFGIAFSASSSLCIFWPSKTKVLAAYPTSSLSFFWFYPSFHHMGSEWWESFSADISEVVTVRGDRNAKQDRVPIAKQEADC